MFDCTISGNSSAGRASVSQTEGRGFESRFPLIIFNIRSSLKKSVIIRYEAIPDMLSPT
jgi:hypothetical protein